MSKVDICLVLPIFNVAVSRYCEQSLACVMKASAQMDLSALCQRELMRQKSECDLNVEYKNDYSGQDVLLQWNNFNDRDLLDRKNNTEII